MVTNIYDRTESQNLLLTRSDINGEANTDNDDLLKKLPPHCLQQVFADCSNNKLH